MRLDQRMKQNRRQQEERILQLQVHLGAALHTNEIFKVSLTPSFLPPVLNPSVLFPRDPGYPQVSTRNL